MSVVWMNHFKDFKVHTFIISVYRNNREKYGENASSRRNNIAGTKSFGKGGISALTHVVCGCKLPRDCLSVSASVL